MSKRDQLLCKTPASCYGKWYRDGLPCGNGKIGLLIHGGIEEETILINHSQLWHWGKNSPIPDVSETLEQTRRLIDQGDYRAANPISSKALLDKGYDSQLFKPCPLADMKITLKNCEPFSGYSRKLYMDKAEIETGWKYGKDVFSRKCFASRKRNLFVFRQECDGRKVSGTLALRLHKSFGPDTARMERECADTLEICSDGGHIYYAFRNDDGKDCGIVLKVVSDGALQALPDGSASYEDSSYLTVLGIPYIGTCREEAFANLLAELETIPEDYKRLLKEHVSLHKEIYAGSEVILADRGFDYSNEKLLLDAYEGTVSNAMLEKLWRYGRYLFICATGEDALPVPLYGLWHGEYDAIWSHNMANINIQMVYWHSFHNNLLSMNKTFIDYYYGLMDQFRESARQLFGMRGIYLSAGSTPGFGRPNQIVPVITNWIAAAGWVAIHFYKYYLYTGDEIYLKEKIIPFMLEAAQFYEDYLVMTEDGVLRCYPSVSPENTPGNLMPKEAVDAMSHACPTCENAVMDFAIIKELFRDLIDLSEKGVLKEEEIKNYRTLLKAIPPYQYNEDGSVKEWLDEKLEDNTFHRHISHLYPVFPGEEVDAEEDPDLAKGFLKAVENRELGGQTGWSFCHTACVLARLKQAEKAMEFMEILARSCLTGSFLSMHNDWRNMGMSLNLGERSPIQLDASIGYVAVIQEMLFTVINGTVKLLPALPDRFAKGKVRRFTAPGAEISMEWSGENFCAEIEVKGKHTLKVMLPDRYEDFKVNVPDGLICARDGRMLAIRSTVEQKEKLIITGIG